MEFVSQELVLILCLGALLLGPDRIRDLAAAAGALRGRARRLAAELHGAWEEAPGPPPPGDVTPSAPAAAASPPVPGFVSHLRELRLRTLVTLAAFVAALPLAAFFAEPWVFRRLLEPLGERQLLYLSLSEGFLVHWGVTWRVALVIALPVAAYQAWAFVAPGLYPRERRAAVGLAFVSILLFVAGAAFSFLAILPVAVLFFLSFESAGLRYAGAVSSYLEFAAGLILAGGFAFQVPLVMLGLMKAGLVERKTFARWRREWFLLLVVAGAALTPTGDAATLAAFCLPLWLLFESALLAARGLGL